MGKISSSPAAESELLRRKLLHHYREKDPLFNAYYLRDLVTGNTRHFPQSHKTTKIVTGRPFLDILSSESEK
jgi:hypothetical protein